MEENTPAHRARRILIGRIENLAIGRDDAELGFERRLAADNGWTEPFAGRVAAEYRRFIALVACADEEFTPSDAVDQAWHLHMVYTRDYWHGLCRDIVGRDIHHEPTSGGVERCEHYRTRYARTLELYRQVFGAEPPPDIWPDPKVRFHLRHARIDLLRNKLMGPRDARFLAAFMGAMALLSVFGWNVLVAMVAALTAFAMFATAAHLEAGTMPPASGGSSGGGCSADAGCGGDGGGCGGGCGGCG